MNHQLYHNLIFELSHPGRRGYTLPKNALTTAFIRWDRVP